MGIHCSPWHLILDLSAPEGSSVNDGMPKELASLSYISIDSVVAEVLKKGKGTLLAKMDVKLTYRNIPVQPKDRHLLGMHWRGEVIVYMVLPFGLHSASPQPCGKWERNRAKLFRDRVSASVLFSPLMCVANT